MGDESEENVAWSYEQPMAPVAGIKDYVAFYAGRVQVLEETAPGQS